MTTQKISLPLFDKATKKEIIKGLLDCLGDIDFKALSAEREKKIIEILDKYRREHLDGARDLLSFEIAKDIQYVLKAKSASNVTEKPLTFIIEVVKSNLPIASNTLEDLKRALYYCEVQKKSTEFTLEYLQSEASCDLDTVLLFLEQNASE